MDAEGTQAAWKGVTPHKYDRTGYSTARSR